jgi:polysaccharide biosynthesis transport protein
MELSTIFRVLIDKKWILLSVPVIAALAAYFFSLNTEKKYRSSTVLSTGFTTNEGIQITDERVDLWGASVKFDNLIQKMNSEQVMALLSYQLLIHDLTETPTFRSLKKQEDILAGKTALEIEKMVSVLKEKLSKMEMLSSFDEKENELVGLMDKFGYSGWIIKKNLRIGRTGSTDFVEVSYVSENPRLSAFIVNTLSEEFIRFDSSLKSSNSSESVKFFANLVDEKRKMLDDKTKFLDQFKASNNLTGEDFGEIKSTQLVSYDMLRQEKLNAISAKQFNLISVEQQLTNFENKGGTDARVVNEKIVQIRSKINELNQIYVSAGSTDKQLEESINLLRTQLQTEMNKLASTGVTGDPSAPKVTKEGLIAKKSELQLELQILNSNLLSLDQTIAGLRGSVYSSASKKSTIETLTMEIERASEEYNQSVEKYNTERNKSLLAQSSIKISQRAQPNGSPESSKRALIIGMAFMASLALCVFVVVGMEFVDQKIKTPNRFLSHADLNLIGWINEIDTVGLDLKSLFKEKSKDDSTEGFKQYLRKIRFEVESSAAKVLLLTSTKQGEGKTFVTLSLAYSLSLLNKRILIIDTNFRNNSLTKLLIAAPNFQKMLQQDGQVKLLTSKDSPGDGKETEANTNSNIISKTSDPNIDVIGSNIGSESPSEILAGRNFSGMMVQLRSRYDYILMEGASLNDYSDSKELLTFADKVITVFSADSKIEQIDRESINFIRSLKDAFLGAILNKVNEKNIA